MRTDIGFSSGHTRRTRSKISSGTRIRFGSAPPYSSSRRFVRGEMKLARR
jgi:hypothetical protein